jgi:hypothetical protein
MKLEHATEIGTRENVCIQDPETRVGGNPIAVGEHCACRSEKRGLLCHLYPNAAAIVRQPTSHNLSVGVKIYHYFINSGMPANFHPDL